MKVLLSYGTPGDPIPGEIIGPVTGAHEFYDVHVPTSTLSTWTVHVSEIVLLPHWPTRALYADDPSDPWADDPSDHEWAPFVSIPQVYRSIPQVHSSNSLVCYMQSFNGLPSPTRGNFTFNVEGVDDPPTPDPNGKKPHDDRPGKGADEPNPN